MPQLVRRLVEFEGRLEERTVAVEGEDLPVWPAGHPLSVVGTPVPRVDGPERVSGTATYTADLYPAGLLHGVMLRSPHAHARIRRLDVSAAERAPRVRLVLSSLNAPKIPWYNGLSWLFDTELRYAGDEVAAVIADDLAAARDALELIEVEYEVLPHVVDPEEALRPGSPQVYVSGNVRGGEPDVYVRGDPAAGLAGADVRIDLRAETQDVLHHSMEPHVSVAQWTGDRLTIWDSTQHIFGIRREVAECLRVPIDHVRVLSPFMGGGFGSKNFAGKYTVVAALAARALRRPVKLMYTRAEESVAAGKRARSVQRIRVGARRDGTLVAIDYWGVLGVGMSLPFTMGLGGPVKELYACPNLRAETMMVFTHTGPTAPFRAPGFVEGTVGLECAIDALADALECDPLELRLRNYAEADQVLGRNYSSKFLREAYEMGAEAIGWARRRPAPKTPVRDGGRRTGLGMATQMWTTGGSPPAYADIRLMPDGRANVRVGTQDLGTGAKTALAQIAAEILTLPVSQVDVYLGDTDLPYAPISAGSQTITSCGPAVRMAAEEARGHLVDAAASWLETAPQDVRLEAGRLSVAGVRDRGISVLELTGKLGNFTIMGRGFRGTNPDGLAFRTWGAQFAEVEVDPETGEVAVLKIVACHDVGRVINPLQYASQIQGGVIQGIGMALSEEHATDSVSGAPSDLGFDAYAVPRVSMIPDIVALAVGKPDPVVNNIGAKGVGEPPIIPTPAAIANAIANAVGARITSLPITPVKILQATGRLARSG